MKKQSKQGRWNDIEKEAFMQCILLNNFNWNHVAVIVGSRTASQCRSHYQKMVIKERINKTEKGVKISRFFPDFKNKVRLSKFGKSSSKNSSETSTEDRKEMKDDFENVIEMNVEERCDFFTQTEEINPEIDINEFEYFNF